jgi:hypothetical protein
MDLFTYLLDQFKETEHDPKVNKAAVSKSKNAKLDQERLSTKLANIEHFVEFAKKFLQKNQPSQVDHLVEGLGITLTNGTKVRIVPKSDKDKFEAAGDLENTPYYSF